MAERGAQPMDIPSLLEAVEQAAPVEAVDVIARALRDRMGAHHVSLLMTNFSGTALVRLSHVSDETLTRDGDNERADEVLLEGSLYEHGMFVQRPTILRVGDTWRVLAPVIERGDALGLLEASVGAEPSVEVIDDMAAAAHALAYILIASRRHTDLFEWAQRDLEFSLAAEMQRRLLPDAYTVQARHFTLAGWLEPAHDVGGDTFDYSLDREYLYVSMTDAIGHGVEAALLATLVVGSLRNTRRRRATPAEQADAANEALLSRSEPDQFVTGQILRICLADGRVDFVNAGHPNPYLLRGGRSQEVEIASPQLPLGIMSGRYETETAMLQPGDRLVLLTDGYLERNAVRLDVSSLLQETLDRHPREVVRGLAGQVLDATGGNLLDDATILCIDWHGSEQAPTLT